MTKINEVSFTDADIVNPDDYIAAGEYNPYNVRLFVAHDHGVIVGAAFAECRSDALDKLADANKLDHLRINPENEHDREDYMTTDVKEIASGFDPDCVEHESPDGTMYWWKKEPAFLGNAIEPFDIDTLSVFEVPCPKMSICALLDAEGSGVSAVDDCSGMQETRHQT